VFFLCLLYVFILKDSVCCSDGGGRFSEVANLLQVWDFQSVTRALSTLGSVSTSRRVRSGRFYCISCSWCNPALKSAVLLCSYQPDSLLVNYPKKSLTDTLTDKMPDFLTLLLRVHVHVRGVANNTWLHTLKRAFATPRNSLYTFGAVITPGCIRMLLFLYSDGNEMDPTNSSYATYNPA